MGILRPLAVLAALVTLTPCLPTLRAEAEVARQDAFTEANLAFRELYAQARAATLAKIGPVIVVEMDKLILLHGDTRSEATAIPAVYHRLKSISHVPLAIYVALAPFGDAPVVGERLARLRAFRVRIDEISESLESSGLSPAQVERSRLLLYRCAAFLDGVLEKGRYESAALMALTRSAAPVALANAEDAVKSQIDAYHSQVTAWRRLVPESEWSKLHVVIRGPQMPRKHNVPVQYFAKLLGQSGESRRLIYAEESSGEKQALNLLATHQLDSELAVAFFGDSDRMEIDLLGNAASVYLDKFDIGQ